MPRVYKYPVPYSRTDEFELTLPLGARILSVGIQGRTESQLEPMWEEIVLWAEVKDARDHDISKAPTEIRRFLCVNTGNRYSPEPTKFIGSVTTANGTVWHLFELV